MNLYIVGEALLKGLLHFITITTNFILTYIYPLAHNAALFQFVDMFFSHATCHSSLAEDSKSSWHFNMFRFTISRTYFYVCYSQTACRLSAVDSQLPVSPCNKCSKQEPSWFFFKVLWNFRLLIYFCIICFIYHSRFVCVCFHSYQTRHTVTDCLEIYCL